MSSVERVYAMFIEANPVPEPGTLPETHEDLLDAKQAVGPDSEAEIIEFPPIFVPRRAGRRVRGWAAAAAVILVMAAGVVALVRSGEPSKLASGGQPTPASADIEQAVEFITRVESGDVDGAIELLSEPLGSVWFIPIGQATGSEQISDYLDFYVAFGVSTRVADCEVVVEGPRTIVTCRAEQQAGALELLGLTFPPFDMTFEVWEDGIRTVGWVEDAPGDFDRAFGASRFFDFRNSVAIPAGLIQPTGDPVWSKTNGETLRRLATEFASGPG